MNYCCEYTIQEFNLITPEDESLILFDAENELNFIDFSWEQSFDQNLDDTVTYDLIVTNVIDNEIVFSTTTENLNFVIPVFILYDDGDQPIDERTYRWIVTATDDSELHHQHCVMIHIPLHYYMIHYL